MALIVGDQTADTGMSKAIYDQLRSVLEPGLEGLSGDALWAVQESYQKLPYAIARGVIDHIMANMKVVGIYTLGNVNTAVQGNTTVVSGHQHGVNLLGVQNNAVFTQSNDGTGHVK